VSEIPSPLRVTEEESSSWNSKTAEHFILEQIKILSQEVVRISDKIKENEAQRETGYRENWELKKMLSRLESSIIDLGGNIQDENLSIQGRTSTKNQCTETCALL
jgi:hypothetical protein